ncbi:MAG: NAD-dependent epimerase/dehydratase family protein [Pseudomonadota bacterium]
MKILVTGATGYVGYRLAVKLAARGDEVVGGVRSQSRESALPSSVQPLVLNFDTAERWGDAAAGVDAVIHTAFSGHRGDFEAACARDQAAVESFIKAMDGSGKTLIVSNGTAFLGDSGEGALDETAPILTDHPAAPRAHATVAVHGDQIENLRTVELRLASFVYGHGGSVFLPVLLAAAKRDGRSIYVGDGAARTSTVHVDAAVDAYIAALDQSHANGVYHIASDDSPTVREIAGAIAQAAGGVPVTGVDMDTAASVLDPFTAFFLTVNNRLDSDRARADLGWDGTKHVGLLSEVATGSYASAE